jgi:hypothetical protein
MPNAICTEQNLEGKLRHFLASRVWYKRTRWVAFIQALIAFGIPLGSAILLYLGGPTWRVWTSTAAITAAILDAILLDRLQRYFRSNGANEQEIYDCDLLGIDWPSGLAGSPPPITRTVDAAKGCDPADYQNWYPDVGRIPKWQGALICQHCNSWWDAKVRRRYVIGLSAALGMVTALLLSLGIWKGLTFEQNILMIYAPLSSMLIWTIRELLRHHETSQLSERTEKLAAATWKSALADEIKRKRWALRELQDAIYYRRRTSPCIPTFLQNLQRQSYLDTMQKTAADMVHQAEEKLRQRRSGRSRKPRP